MGGGTGTGGDVMVATDVFRIVGRESGHAYASGSVPEATEISRAHLINTMFDLVMKSSIEPLKEGDTLAVEFLAAFGEDDKPVWLP